MQIMNAHVKVNRTDRQSHQMQHIRTQPSLRGKYISWHSLTLFWILIVEQVSTPLHNRCTVRGVETKAMYQLFQKQVAHLCSGNEVTGKKRNAFITSIDRCLPLLRKQAPQTWHHKARGLSRSVEFASCQISTETKHSPHRADGHGTGVQRWSCKAVIMVRKRTADKCCERRLLERNIFPHWPHQEGWWNPRTESCSGERDDRSALISVTDTIQQNDTYSPEIR